jgi:DNA-binding XRE family transcriptional regulator
MRRYKSRQASYGPADKTNYRMRLIEARERKKLSRHELAQKLGIVRTGVFRIEAGKSDPSLALLSEWLAALAPYATFEFFLPPCSRKAA